MILEELLLKINFLEFIGNKKIKISNVSIFDETNTESSIIMWVNAKNSDRANFLLYGILICEKTEDIQFKPTCNYIIVENARSVFNDVVNILFPKEHVFGISSSATIDSSCKISSSAYIGNNVVIERNCQIGENTIIGHNTVINEGSIIGQNVVIGSNNVIGGTGFGYVKDNDRLYKQMNHIGNVIIEDGVEVGNNTCIDRAVMGSTILKKNCKIDNLVHIAHGVIIGENSLIIAHAMIAGSSVIGKNVWVAPGACILNKISVSDNSTIGMGAVVIKNVEIDGDIVVGNPAKSIKK
jgi:UDP-3-O-[3-hydroxymyristoyl] glucosamine N-acyltransferase